jgi:UDP-N-acetylmuramyl pentapeptide synthase
MLKWDNEVVEGTNFWYCFPWEISLIDSAIAEDAPYVLSIEGVTDDDDNVAFVDLAYLPTLEAAQELAEELHQKMIDEFENQTDVIEPL